MKFTLHTPDGIQYRDASLVGEKELFSTYVRLMICGLVCRNDEEKEAFYRRLAEIDEKLFS